MNIKSVQEDILRVYHSVVHSFESKPNAVLEQLRHEADEIRHNRNRDWSERTAAEMIYTATTLKLGL